MFTARLYVNISLVPLRIWSSFSAIFSGKEPVNNIHWDLACWLYIIPFILILYLNLPWVGVSFWIFPILMDIVISCHVSFSKCHFAHFEIVDYSFLGLYFWHAFIIFKDIFLLLILSFSTINSEWTWLWIILAAHFCMNLFSPELLVGGKVQNSFSHFSEFLLLLFLFDFRKCAKIR